MMTNQCWMISVEASLFCSFSTYSQADEATNAEWESGFNQQDIHRLSQRINPRTSPPSNYRSARGGISVTDSQWRHLLDSKTPRLTQAVYLLHFTPGKNRTPKEITTEELNVTYVEAWVATYRRHSRTPMPCDLGSLIAADCRLP